MSGFTPFTDNYSDLSDQNGYQFEFRCDICGSGYRSEFERSNLGTASNLLSGASNLIGAGTLIMRDTKDDEIYKAERSRPSKVPVSRIENLGLIT